MGTSRFQQMGPRLSDGGATMTVTPKAWAAAETRNVPTPAYAELHCLSNFSFLRGASHAEELVTRAKELGYAALAITDECSLAGVVRAHSAAKKIGGIKLLIGAEFTLDCGLRLVLIARDRAGYGRLSRLITRGRRKAQKGSYSLTRADVEEFVADGAAAKPGEIVSEGTLALWLPSLFSWRAWRRGAGRANGCARISRAAPGSRWSSCVTAATASGSRAAASSAPRWIFRWPRPATCTCTCASAAACRMR